MRILVIKNVAPSAPFNALLIRSGRLVALARMNGDEIVSLYRLNSKTLVYEIQSHDGPSRWMELTPLPDGGAIRAEVRVASVWKVA